MKNYIEISARATFEGRELSDLVLSAFDFCERYGVRIFAQQIAERPDGLNNDWGGNKYRIRITRNHRLYTLYYTDSVCNQQLGLIPTCYDIPSCLEKSFDGDMGDFIAEFGYQIDNAETFRKVERTWKAIKRECAAVKRLFGDWGEACYDELCEIC